jgi:hypothetical protein
MFNELTSVTIPDGVTFIGTWAFFGSRLTEVTIPANTTTAARLWLFSFPGNLDEVYTRNGSWTGTYTSDDDGEAWARQ